MAEPVKRSGRQIASLIASFIVVAGLHGLYIYGLVQMMQNMSGVSWSELFDVGVWAPIALLILMFAPIILGVLELYALFKLTEEKVTKLLLGAELPLLLFSLVFLSMQSYTLPGAVFLYMIAVLSIGALVVRILRSPERLKPQTRLARLIDRGLALTGAGVFSYLGLLWFAFIPFLAYVPFLILSAGYYAMYSFSWMSVIALVLAVVSLFTIYYMPFYSVFLYWRELDLTIPRFIAVLPEKVRYVVWRLIGFVLVFGIGVVLNASLFNKDSDPLHLTNRDSYRQVINSSTEELTKLFVTTYRYERNFFLESEDLKGILSSCSGLEDSALCKLYDGVVNIVLLPVTFQGERILPYGSSNVDEVLGRVYENEIPKSIDVTEIEQAVNKLEKNRNRGRYYNVKPISTPIAESKFVTLKTIHVTTNVLRTEGLQESIVYLEFGNTQRALQEAQMLLKLPDGAVVTDLLLGLNLELTSLVGPEGAADRVYTRSIQRKIDPAVLAKLAPSIYSLKVYPIPMTTGVGTVAQKIKITYVAPISSRIVLPVIQNVRNTDIGYDSVVKGTITFPGTVAKATSETALLGKMYTEMFSGQSSTTIPWSFDVFSSYMDGEQVITITDKITPYCVEKPIYSAEATVYLDISYSAHEYLAEYKQLFTTLFRKYSKVHVIELNHEKNKMQTFESEASAQSYLKEVQFWGVSSNKIMHDTLFAEENQDRDVYIVTDENTYEDSDDYKVTYAYNRVTGKMWNVIAAGVYKPPVNQIGNIAAATGGISTSIDTFAERLELNCQDNPTLAGVSGALSRDMIEKMKLAAQNEALLLEISDEESFVTVGRKMYVIAGRNHFVDSLNSFIAVVNDEQRRQLQEEAEKDEAFEIGQGNLTRVSIGSPTSGNSNAWSPNMAIEDSSPIGGMFGNSGFSSTKNISNGEGSSSNGSTPGGNTSTTSPWLLVFGVVPVLLGVYVAGKKTKEKAIVK